MCIRSISWDSELLWKLSKLDAGTHSLGSQSLADVRQRFPPVYLRLPGAEKIQVGTMQHQNLPEASRRGRPRFATLRGGFHGGQFAVVSADFVQI